MEENCFSFENLRVYQDARQLVVVVYRLSSKFPRTEAFALCQQLQRSIVSVPSNIAEGSGHRSVKEKIHFIEIAYGSLMEAYCQLEIASDLAISLQRNCMTLSLASMPSPANYRH